MQPHRYAAAAWIAVGLFLSPARAASLFTEPFTDASGGWHGLSGQMTVTNTLTAGNPAGCLRGVYPNLGLTPPPPDTEAFVATGLLTSANFVGNYADVDAFLLGFDLRSETLVPGTEVIAVNLVSTTNKITRPLPALITQAGIWYRVRVALDDPARDGWQGNVGAYAQIMSNVTRLEIEVNRTGSGAQTYLLDNVFLARLPEALALAGTTNGVAVTWLHLRTGEPYRLEATPDPALAAWSAVTNFTATNAVQVLWRETTNAVEHYRMVIP